MFIKNAADQASYCLWPNETRQIMRQQARELVSGHATRPLASRIGHSCLNIGTIIITLIPLINAVAIRLFSCLGNRESGQAAPPSLDLRATGTPTPISAAVTPAVSPPPLPQPPVTAEPAAVDLEADNRRKREQEAKELEIQRKREREAKDSERYQNEVDAIEKGTAGFTSDATLNFYATRILARVKATVKIYHALNKTVKEWTNGFISREQFQKFKEEFDIIKQNTINQARGLLEANSFIRGRGKEIDKNVQSQLSESWYTDIIRINDYELTRLEEAMMELAPPEGENCYRLFLEVSQHYLIKSNGSISVGNGTVNFDGMNYSIFVRLLSGEQVRGRKTTLDENGTPTQILVPAVTNTVDGEEVLFDLITATIHSVVPPTT